MLSNVLILVMWQKCVQNIYKKRIQLGKTYIDLLIIQKIFYAVFEDDDLSCTGKFCYRHRNFQNTEAATGSVLKNSN